MSATGGSFASLRRFSGSGSKGLFSGPSIGGSPLANLFQFRLIGRTMQPYKADDGGCGRSSPFPDSCFDQANRDVILYR